MIDGVMSGERKKHIGVFLIILAAPLFVMRSVFFAFLFGGVEHDSGWYLGVARNLAQRGIYASYTNTIREEKPGAHPSLHGRYSVQDEQGFSYFPAGVTAGPGYVIFEAAAIKLFGHGWWQYRLWSLISFAGLLLVAFLIAYRLGGMVGLVLFQVWLWVTPHITTQFAYESYGEHVALFYLLLSFLLIVRAQSAKKKNLLFGLSGLLFSFSILTKYLFLLAGVAFLILSVIQLVKVPKRLRRAKVVSWIIWTACLLLPIFAFELYKYLFLVKHFGIESWRAVNQDFILHFKSNGGGLSFVNIDWGLVLKKTMFWKEIAIAPLIAWVMIFVSTLIFVKNKNKNEKNLYLLLFIAFLSTVSWFILLSTFSWTRHVWLGVVVGMILISATIGQLLRAVNKKFYSLIILFLVIFVETSLFQFQDKLEPRFVLGQQVIHKWNEERYASGLQGLPANPIIPLNDQEELISYFDKNVLEPDRVYYLGWFLVAEASPLVDKVFFSLDRYLKIGQINPAGGKSYLIIGPYQKGKYSIVGEAYHDKKVSQLCKKMVFNNPSYTLCTLKTGLVYENRAYD